MTGSDDGYLIPLNILDYCDFLEKKSKVFKKPARSSGSSACDRRAFQKRVEKRRKKKGYK